MFQINNYMKYIFPFILLLLVSCSKSPIPNIIGNPLCQPISSMDQAAIQALNSVYTRDKEVEWAGIIYKQNSGYCFSSPIQGNDDTFAFQTQIKISALYHTHPLGEANNLFSQEDINQSIKLNVPSYIGVIGDNQVKKFTSTDEIYEYTPDYKVSNGEVIGELMEKK